MPDLNTYVLRDMPITVTMTDIDLSRLLGYALGVAEQTDDPEAQRLYERFHAALTDAVSSPGRTFRVESSSHEPPCEGCWIAAQRAVESAMAEGGERHSAEYIDPADIEHRVAVFEVDPMIPVDVPEERIEVPATDAEETP